MRFPSGMESRLFSKLRRQTTFTGRKHHWPPPFNYDMSLHSRREPQKNTFTCEMNSFYSYFYTLKQIFHYEKAILTSNAALSCSL